MPTYRIVFRDAEKQDLLVKAAVIEGHAATDTRDSYVFRVGRRVVAVVPKNQVQYFEQVDADD